MSPVGVPTSIDDVTSRWLTEALASARPGVQVLSVERTELIHGTATKAKFHLTYNEVGKSAGLPNIMWLKSALEPHTAEIAPMGIYEAEAVFYRDLGVQLPVNIPVCFYAGVDEQRRVGAMLLEDFGERQASLGYAARPASIDQAAATLEALARMHGHWWRSPRLATLPARRAPPTAWTNPFTRYQEPSVIAELFEDARADGVPSILLQPQRLSRVVKIWQALSNEPVCFIHGDSHLGNVFYDKDGRSGHYDWQNYRAAHWCHDVSYFLGSALRVRDRERSERVLVAHYVERLRAAGIDELDFETAWLTYRQFLIYGFWIFLANFEAMQPFEVNSTYVTRFAAAVRDHDSYRLLEEV